LDDIGATLPLRSVAFVSTATDEIEALAKIEHPFRGDAAMFVGFSRIALCAHYLGVLWLMICALLLRPMRRSVVVPVAVAVEEPRPATAVTVFDRTVDSALKL
jgi:hypothetical protein